MNDEYTADPVETEREAARVLRQMKNDRARAEVAQIAEEERARRIAENTYTKNYTGNTRSGGGSGGAMKLNRDITKSYKKGGLVTKPTTIAKQYSFTSTNPKMTRK
jgi:hypothetical protein